MAPKYKLTYFPIKGLGEPIRFVLSYIGADFEDNRINFEDWPKVKPTTPYGKLPYLEVDGKVLCQSVAICRYLGKQAGIAGSNDWENYLIDEGVDVVRDTITDFILVIRETDEAKKAEKQKTLVNELLPAALEKLDNRVKQNGGYLANNKLSWGDLYAVAALEFLGERVEVDLFKLPNLKNLHDKVFGNPKIKAWVDKRPKDKPRQ